MVDFGWEVGVVLASVGTFLEPFAVEKWRSLGMDLGS